MMMIAMDGRWCLKRGERACARVLPHCLERTTEAPAGSPLEGPSGPPAASTASGPGKKQAIDLSWVRRVSFEQFYDILSQD